MFKLLKQALVFAPLVNTPDWTKSFELMCNASDFSIGAMLDQWDNKVFYTIYSVSIVGN